MVLSLLSILTLPHSIAAQTPLSVDREEAKQHLQKSVPPSYPPMALAAHIQGEVLLKITIGTDGHVKGVEALSGPPMLISSAADTMRERVYSPFLINGVPTEATTTASVVFRLSDPQDLKDAQHFHHLFAKCNEALRQNAPPRDAIAACQPAGAAADSLTGPFYTERRTAYVFYATALLRGQQAKEAVNVGEKAIALAQSYHDDSSVVYAVTGQAKAASGDMPGADRDLETAEDYARKALYTPTGRSERPVYISTLKSLLKLHAQVLTALGKSADAEEKTDEANKL